MKIYTSYFGNMKNIPEDMVPISICGKPPDWYTGAQYRKLAPKYWFFKLWKENHDNNLYVENFINGVLKPINRYEVYVDISKITGGKDAVLLCYEKSDDFCHRHLVAEWFRQKGVEVEEWGGNNGK